jgi:hypothetical protein
LCYRELFISRSCFYAAVDCSDSPLSAVNTICDVVFVGQHLRLRGADADADFMCNGKMEPAGSTTVELFVLDSLLDQAPFRR